jgi:REP element-mobilizing transposase RayT
LSNSIDLVRRIVRLKRRSQRAGATHRAPVATSRPGGSIGPAASSNQAAQLAFKEITVGSHDPPYFFDARPSIVLGMPNYRRYFVKGGTYFFTVVTFDRAPILTTDLGRDCLGTALREIRDRWPFEAIATVLLPDHWHTVWSLPSGDADYSTRLRRIKERFTELWLAAGKAERPVGRSRK